MTDLTDDAQTYITWTDDIRKSRGGPTTDLGVADLKAYLDLPKELAAIVPFSPPVIDDEVIELLGRFFKE